MTSKKTWLALLVAGCMGLATGAGAHVTPKPNYGGVVLTAQHLDFELVALADRAVLYVEDHGDLVPTVHMRGRLTVVSGLRKVVIPLAPAGQNRLEAPGVRLLPGAKVFAEVTLEAGRSVVLDFSLK